jgi:hypothetical protein
MTQEAKRGANARACAATEREAAARPAAGSVERPILHSDGVVCA